MTGRLSSFVFHRCISLVFVLTLFISHSVYGQSVQSGSLNLSSWDADVQPSISLHGEWRFFKDEFINRLSESTSWHMSYLPSTWSGFRKAPAFIPAIGSGTYHLLIESPGEHFVGLQFGKVFGSYKVKINGHPVARCGEPALLPTDEKPCNRSLTAFFSIPAGESELVIQFSNHINFRGGIQGWIVLGTPEFIMQQEEQQFLYNVILAVTLFFTAVYFTFLYFLRPQEKSFFALAILLIISAFHLLFSGHTLIRMAIPTFSRYWLLQLQYLTLALIFPLLLSYIITLFKDVRKGAVYIFELFTWGVVVVSILTYLAFRLDQTPLLIPAMRFYFLFISVVPLVFLIRRARRKEQLVVYTLFGYVPFVITVAILTASRYQTDFKISFFDRWSIVHAVAIFMLSQLVYHSLQFISALFKSEKFTEHLQLLNTAYARFVPNEFLQLIQRKSVLDIKQGDQNRMKITILVSDIRNFTGISETMSPEENFYFINEYLSVMSPIIHDEGGFVDKFLGDGIMALFSNSPKNALNAALRMESALAEFNANVASEKGVAVHVGIGIHTGQLIVGVVGNESRLDGTVISDAVNTAHRVQDLTRYFNSPVLMTMDSLIELDELTGISFRLIGEVRVKGKQNTVGVAEMLDAIKEPELFLKTSSSFEEGLEYLVNGEFQDAQHLFQSILHENPNDKAATMYLELCRHRNMTGDRYGDIVLNPGYRNTGGHESKINIFENYDDTH